MKLRLPLLRLLKLLLLRPLTLPPRLLTLLLRLLTLLLRPLRLLKLRLPSNQVFLIAKKPAFGLAFLLPIFCRDQFKLRQPKPSS